MGGGTEGWRQRVLRDLSIDRMTRKQRRDTVWLLAGIPAMALTLGFLTKDAQFSNAFYETVAQVIPVFLLAFAVEQRAFRDDPSADPDIRIGRRVFVVVAVIGEAICLAVIAYGDDPMLFRGAVLLTLLGMGVMFSLLAIHGPPSDPATASATSTARLEPMELPVLKSDRLALRPLTDDDIEVLLPAVYEPGIAEWWGDTSDADYQREGFRNEGRAFTIQVGENVAGWVCFHEETEPDYRQVALDIMLRPGFQDQGLGPDALRLLIRWFIDEHGHHRFAIDPSAKNDRAIKAYTNIGFKPVGILRKAERAPSGHWRDSLLMDLLAEDLD